MLSGVAVLVFGFILMSLDKADYGFGFLGITLGPLVVMAGFGIQFWAILHKDTSSTASKNSTINIKK